MASEKTDIVIVGAGMVGASLALRLAKSTGFDVTLIENNPTVKVYEKEDFDPRVVALSHASINYLEQANIWSSITGQRACPYYQMQIWDGDGTGRVTFDCRDSHDPDLGYIVENSVVVKALRDAIESNSAIHFRKNLVVRSFEKGRVYYENSSGEKGSLDCSLVIAADGAQSQLRKLLNIPTREWSYRQSAIVCTVKTQLPHQFTCYQRFTGSGPIAFLPLALQENSYSKDEFYSSLVWSCDEEKATSIMHLGDEEFCRQLEREFEFTLGELSYASKRYCLPLRQRHAVDYVLPGFALVGDAAHTIHPLAGQGVNLGFADVAVLLEEIQRAEQRKIPLDHFSLLQRYQRRRKSHNLATMAAMEGFKRLFGADDVGLRWARNTGMNIFNTQGWLKRRITRLAAGQMN